MHIHANNDVEAEKIIRQKFYDEDASRYDSPIINYVSMWHRGIIGEKPFNKNINTDGTYNYEGGGIITSNELDKLHTGFTLEYLDKLLSEKFPDSHSIMVIEGRRNEQENFGRNKVYGQSEIDRSISGMKFTFPDNREHAIEYDVQQGSENTNYEFVIYDSDILPYTVLWGFKDEGDVDSSYVTKAVAFLQQAYGYPMTVEHTVMSKGGSTYAEGGRLARGGSIYEVNKIGEQDKPLSESLMSAKNLKELKTRLNEVYGTTKGFRIKKRDKDGRFNVVKLAEGGEVGEDEDGNKYEILWGNDKPFKSGDMAYNPMSGIVMEVYFDADDENADDEYYVQETYAQVKKLDSTYAGGGEITEHEIWVLKANVRLLSTKGNTKGDKEIIKDVKPILLKFKKGNKDLSNMPKDDVIKLLKTNIRLLSYENTKGDKEILTDSADYISAISSKRGSTYQGGGEILIVKTKKGLKTMKDFEDFSKDEIKEWGTERGWKYNAEGEKFGGQALKIDEFFVKPRSRYNAKLPSSTYAGGGSIEKQNKAMLENDAVQIEHHSEELNKVVPKTKKVPAWIVGKTSRINSDLSDVTHYLDGKSQVKKKFNSGGTLELSKEKAKKVFHLPYESAIYVPSTSNVDEVISSDEMQSRVDEVQQYLGNLFGGFSSAETMGGFVDSKGSLVNEDIIKVTSFSEKDTF